MDSRTVLINGVNVDLVVMDDWIIVHQRQFWTPGTYGIYDGALRHSRRGQALPFTSLEHVRRIVEAYLWAHSLHPKIGAVITVPDDVHLVGRTVLRSTTIITEGQWEDRLARANDNPELSQMVDLLIEPETVTATDYEYAGLSATV